jgi:hypothetical protein
MDATKYGALNAISHSTGKQVKSNADKYIIHIIMNGNVNRITASHLEYLVIILVIILGVILIVSKI